MKLSWKVDILIIGFRLKDFFSVNKQKLLSPLYLNSRHTKKAVLYVLNYVSHQKSNFFNVKMCRAFFCQVSKL